MKRRKLTPLPARAPFKRTLTLALLAQLAATSLVQAVGHSPESDRPVPEVHNESTPRVL